MHELELTLDTTAFCEKHSDVTLDSTLASPLLANEVRVVGTRDEVVRKRAKHVHITLRSVVGGQKEVCERFDRPAFALAVSVK